MSTNVSKTKCIIFHNKGKVVNPNGLDLNVNDNWRYDLHNIFNIHTLEHIYSTNPNLSFRSYKLLGIHLDENLILNHHYSISWLNSLKHSFFLNA
jgi:hypothetical protein